ncbi:unnamed protein product [Allacma fusca]|uniref:SEC14-like protein 2 n=1 Tax=Allacma fusca TaxID=39272 RepID=A0A8J2PCT4_9HEXA|nr:unnamed protein product [Allacma fusca]
MTAPTAKEQILIHQLRTRLSDLELKDDSDMFLIRWLRGRDLKINQAEDMLRKHIKWCKEYDTDNILEWEPPEVLTRDYPIEFWGRDSENCPNAGLALGKWDLIKIVDTGLRQEFVRYMDQMYFKLLDAMKDQYGPDGVPVTQFNITYDVSGLSLKLMTSVAVLDIYMNVVRRFETNHPETLKACYVVNASKIFSIIFGVVKPVLSQHTFGKILIFDSNASKWIPLLQKAIPLDKLPISCGGHNLKSVLNTDSQSRSDNKGYSTVTVPARGNYPVELNVTESKTIISWSFIVAIRDIGFSVKSRNEELVQHKRVGSSQIPQEGFFICSQPGTYTIVFDNSYSHFRSKEIKYKIGTKLEGISMP